MSKIISGATATMRALAVLLCCMTVLAGCASEPHPFVVRRAILIVDLVDEPGQDWPRGAVGITRNGGTGFSQIEVLIDYYHECIKHELDHGFKGKWHKDRRATCR
jgi:hypothetical protein